MKDACSREGGCEQVVNTPQTAAPPVFCVGARLPGRSGKVFEAPGRQSKLGMLENAINDSYFFCVCLCLAQWMKVRDLFHVSVCSRSISWRIQPEISHGEMLA